LEFDVAKFRKKPVVIEAVQLRWDNWGEMCEFAGVGYLKDGDPQGCYVQSDGTGNLDSVTDEIGLHIPALHGVMDGVRLARQNDWVIRGVRGELYPCKPDIFESTYEEVSDRVNLTSESILTPNKAREILGLND
jgi:hypothetical protein